MTLSVDRAALETGAEDADHVVPRSAGLSRGWLTGGIVAVSAAALFALAFGPASLPIHQVALEVLDHVPGLDITSGLSELEANIVWEIRLPRVVLGLLVGGLLCVSGASYQGVFRNPLADPYLLGVAAGAGLGATIALVSGLGDGSGTFDAIPMLAFGGGLFAVACTYVLAGVGGRSSATATLLLAGIAMASFFTALQTYVQQRESDSLREVYSWILGSLTTAGWGEVLLLLPYAAATTVVLLWFAPALDVMSVGDDEARALGLRPEQDPPHCADGGIVGRCCRRRGQRVDWIHRPGGPTCCAGGQRVVQPFGARVVAAVRSRVPCAHGSRGSDRDLSSRAAHWCGHGVRRRPVLLVDTAHSEPSMSALSTAPVGTGVRLRRIGAELGGVECARRHRPRCVSG